MFEGDITRFFLSLINWQNSGAFSLWTAPIFSKSSVQFDFIFVLFSRSKSVLIVSFCCHDHKDAVLWFLKVAFCKKHKWSCCIETWLSFHDNSPILTSTMYPNNNHCEMSITYPILSMKSLGKFYVSKRSTVVVMNHYLAVHVKTWSKLWNSTHLTVNRSSKNLSISGN